ncbi:MAG: hypothetical protein ACRDPC_22325, partial [Solirubrobacteraceae bacterium]
MSAAARAQLGIIAAAYLLYSAARWVTIGDLATAQEHAEWILALERDLGLAVERSVQAALTGSWVLWVLNHLYLAAQAATQQQHADGGVAAAGGRHA